MFCVNASVTFVVIIIIISSSSSSGGGGGGSNSSIVLAYTSTGWPQKSKQLTKYQ